MEPPRWADRALGADADIVMSLNVRRLLADADLQGASQAALGSLPEARILSRIEQVDAFARVQGGDVTPWIVVLHGAPPALGFLIDKGWISAERLPSGALLAESKQRNGMSLFVFPSDWVFTKGAERELRTLDVDGVSEPIAMDRDCIFEFAMRGAAVTRMRHEWGDDRRYEDLLDGLQELSGSLCMRADRILTLRGRYGSERQAEHAKKAATSQLALRNLRDASSILRWFEQDTRRRGVEVVSTVKIAVRSEPAALIEPPPAAPVSPPSYPSTCLPSQHYDLDRRRCVRSR